MRKLEGGRYIDGVGLPSMILKESLVLLHLLVCVGSSGLSLLLRLQIRLSAVTKKTIINFIIIYFSNIF